MKSEFCAVRRHLPGCRTQQGAHKHQCDETLALLAADATDSQNQKEFSPPIILLLFIINFKQKTLPIMKYFYIFKYAVLVDNLQESHKCKRNSPTFPTNFNCNHTES